MKKASDIFHLNPNIDSVLPFLLLSIIEKNHFFFISSNVSWGFSCNWCKLETKWNSNNEVLLRDEEAFVELLGMKISKLSLLVIDQSLFDTGISQISP